MTSLVRGKNFFGIGIVVAALSIAGIGCVKKETGAETEAAARGNRAVSSAASAILADLPDGTELTPGVHFKYVNGKVVPIPKKDRDSSKACFKVENATACDSSCDCLCVQGGGSAGITCYTSQVAKK